MIEVWHIRIGSYGRAYVTAPTRFLSKLYFRYRGWKPYNKRWWTLASRNQKEIE